MHTRPRERHRAGRRDRRSVADPGWSWLFCRAGFGNVVVLLSAQGMVKARSLHKLKAKPTSSRKSSIDLSLPTVRPPFCSAHCVRRITKLLRRFRQSDARARNRTVYYDHRAEPRQGTVAGSGGRFLVWASLDWQRGMADTPGRLPNPLLHRPRAVEWWLEALQFPVAHE